MVRPFARCFLAFVFASVLSSVAVGQMVGSRGGADEGDANRADNRIDLPALDREIAEGYITIDGRAENRVRPTEIRIVLAVTSEAETPQQCNQSIDATIEKLKAAWTKMGIGQERIVVDFIAVLPRYEWFPGKHDGRDVEIEKKVGYRMQTNVHVAVRGDAEARAALAKALELGIADIIAFDYWSKDLDDIKTKVREQALKAARGKADSLLALFPERPPMINVQEHTTVQYPESLYHSFTNVANTAVSRPWRDNVPYTSAYRPKNTYYRGLYIDSDVQPRELPMNPEISVISTVRLYFKSPAAEGKKEAAAKPK